MENLNKFVNMTPVNLHWVWFSIVINCQIILAQGVDKDTIDVFDSSTQSGTPPYTDYQGKEDAIVWWTPFTGIQGQSRSCSLGSCYFTEDREYVNLTNTKAVLFYGSDFNVEDLPLPRSRDQWWALLHEESPKNQPLFDHELVLELFNYTSTFKRSSDFPLTLQHLADANSLTSIDDYVPFMEKELLEKSDHLAPVMYVQSDCDTPSERDAYVSELSKYIKIDSYGSCLHNIDLPSHLIDAAANYDHPEFRKLVSKYKFALSIENAACEDYITEKLWRPLTLGTIPIYWGSPSINDWLPNPNSIIHIRDFDSPQSLAQHLNLRMHNQTLYNLHLKHKIEGLITNKELMETLNARKWGINNDFERGNFIEHFECYVCDQILKKAQMSLQKPHENRQANKSHYGCPEPQSVLTGKPNLKGFWVEEWHKARVEAQVLHHLINTKPGTFSSDMFFAEVIDRLQKDGFFHKFHSLHEDL